MTDSLGGRGLNSRQARHIGQFLLSPTAQISSSPSRVLSGVTTVDYSGSGSSDPDGSISSYDWEFPSGSKTGENVSYTHPSQGSDTVELTVTDDQGRKSTATISVDVLTNIVESFDDDLSDWNDQSDAGSGAQIVTTPAVSGSALELFHDDSGSDNAILVSDPITPLPQAGDKFEYRFRYESDSKSAHFAFGIQDPSNPFDAAYMARVDIKDGIAGLAKYNGGLAFKDESSVNWSNHVGDWLKGVIKWPDNGDISVTHYTESGGELTTLNITDTDYSSGSVSFSSASEDSNDGTWFGSVYLDEIKITGEV